MLTAEKKRVLSWKELYILQVEAVELVLWLLVLIVTSAARLRHEVHCVRAGLGHVVEINYRRIIYDRAMALKRRGSSSSFPFDCVSFLVGRQFWRG
jgi:hypothetical protein